MTERQWTVSAEEPVLAVPHWTDPAVALKVAERTGETIWTRPGTGARWIRARLQPSPRKDEPETGRAYAPKTITFGSMPDVTVTGVVRYDEPAGIQCPMPHCPESLTLEYTTSHTLGSGDLYSAPGGPEDGEARTWEVVCAAGHVILLPQDDSGGYCTFDDTDRDRLRDTLRWLAAGLSLMTKGS